MRDTDFADDEYYHIYNRGVDKRLIFSNRHDLERLFLSMKEFNTVEPVGSIHLSSFKLKNSGLKSGQPKIKQEKPLVEFVAYCLNPNHYHFILRQITDGGISEFMKRLGGGYTRYFNDRHQRSGALFQGKYKFAHIDSNDYLMHVSAYINLNNFVHKLSGPTSKLVSSSWEEYINNAKSGFCEKSVVLEQFNNAAEYKAFAREVLSEAIKYKEDLKIDKLLLE
jgi:REP element-mobilizing transposase RayT